MSKPAVEWRVDHGFSNGVATIWLARFKDGRRVDAFRMEPAFARELARQLLSHADRANNTSAAKRENRQVA